MRRIFAVAALAFLAGIAATFLVLDSGQGPFRTLRIETNEIAKMSTREAALHREAHYEGIESIAQTLALPGDFAQTEALYTLAGRSDAVAIQDLIFQAAGIGDPVDRKAALGILFSRLAELDAESALALSRTGTFARDPAIESSVWQSWGRLDLDRALAEVLKIDSPGRRKLAAAALFAAHGFWGNEMTAHIARTLRIEPDPNTRARYIYRLADDDPAGAIETISAMQDPAEQRRAASWLGHYLGKYQSQAARRFAALFHEPALERAYTGAVTSELAMAEPQLVLDSLLSGPVAQADLHTIHSAMRSLASEDLDLAMTYLANLGNSQQRNLLASAVADQLANEDPERALAWARENDKGATRGMYVQVLMSISGARPDLALAEAQLIANPDQRRQALSMIVMNASHHDPERAVSMLDSIAGRDERASAAQAIANNWIQRDPDAALAWILKSDFHDNGAILSQGVQALAQMDPRSAVRWLSRLDPGDQSILKVEIARNLAAQHSIAEAQNFISQYEHGEDYAELLGAAIAGVAQTDLLAAHDLASGLPAGPESDMLRARIIERRAYENPREAADWLASLDDESQRAQATGQVAAAWSRNDPAAAEQWVRSMPRGDDRDQAIMQVASTWDEMTVARKTMVDSVGNPELRKYALLSHIQKAAGSDASEAERLGKEYGLPDQDIEQLKNMIRNVRGLRSFIRHF